MKASANVAGSLLIDHVAARYWDHVGQHHAGEGAANTSRDLTRLVKYFGEAKSLTEIGENDVTKLVAWLRGQQISRRKKIKGKLVQDPAAPLVSVATVNRSTTEVLKKLFTFAKGEGARFDAEPKWKRHILKEPEERVRELQDHEGDLIEDATRDDYRPLFAFVQASGLRQRECVHLKWSEVNFGTKLITKLGKGGKRVTHQDRAVNP